MTQSNFASIIKQCESASGSGSKAIIQASLASADDIACRLIKEAMNPFRTFGIKKIEMPKPKNNLIEVGIGLEGFSGGTKYDTLFFLLDELHSRNLTGNAARQAATDVLSLFNKEEQPYIVRIFDKNLQAGFSSETFNKVIVKTGAAPDKIIPTFEVMLADKCEDTDDFEKHVTFPCQADFKYDGERTIAFVKESEVIYYSRSGIEAYHVKGLFDEDLFKIHRKIGYDFILDGERCSDLGFTDTVNAKKEGNDKAKSNLRFRAFFLMPMPDWLAKKTNITMRSNREALSNLLSSLNLQKIILTEGREVKDYQDMMEYCNEAIDKPENAARKIEGLILKNWDSVYEWERVFSWTKVKRFYDIDARIVDFYPGKPKSRLANTIGGVNCVGFLENGDRCEFNVGSGFSDEQREDMKQNPQSWLSKTHVIKYQEVTKSKSKVYASLRFCTYLHSRDDKHVEI